LHHFIHIERREQRLVEPVQQLENAGVLQAIGP